MSGRGQGGASQNFTLAALRQLGIHLEEGEDIDSFIANLTIPPPPEGSVVSLFLTKFFSRQFPFPNMVPNHNHFFFLSDSIENSSHFQDLQAYAETRRMGGGEYDISAFIIPPPPTSDEKDNRSSDIIRRLYEAKEGISKVSNFGLDCQKSIH